VKLAIAGRCVTTLPTRGFIGRDRAGRQRRAGLRRQAARASGLSPPRRAICRPRWRRCCRSFADNDLLADTLEIGNGDGSSRRVYRARRQGEVAAAIFQTSARGYSGDVLVLIGVDRSGVLLGARVIKHAETPGLGDKIDLAKSPWILSFNGLSLATLPPEKWAVKKDGGVFDQMAGATITPRAVVKAVKEGLDFFRRASRGNPAGRQNTVKQLVRRMKDGLWLQNVVFAQMLALCPAMAVTTSGTNGLGMGLATTAVLITSNVLVASIRSLVSRRCASRSSSC
jgi:RnfABCDGE-type electron transport complex G subunit